MADKQYKKTIFIFRRDLRLEDNTGLLAACRMSDEVIPVFCFDPRQAEESQNDYYSENAFRFMCQALVDVDERLKARDSKLHLLSGNPTDELAELIKDEEADAVFFNADYTPFAIERDSAIADTCKELGIDCRRFPDVSLTVPGEVLTNAGDPYKVFSAFERKARETYIRKPQANGYDNFVRVRAENISGVDLVKKYQPVGGDEILQTGRRSEALETLRSIEDFSNYDEDRDIPSKKGTTRLSAHLKFGTVSVREVYWAVRDVFGAGHRLISELYWRDFYLHISWHFPQVFGENFNDQYDNLHWENGEEQFARWQEGQTGFPIVDAGMRELLATGWMHNRVRMIVASFLTKDLAIDWRWGEKHFARHLVDYDPSSNNGGWQWAASTGADAQPYFRIFNPWTQGKKHDPEALYIKKWVPELADLPAADIHKLGDKGVPEGVDYPEPIVDHKEKYHEAKSRYQAARQK